MRIPFTLRAATAYWLIDHIRLAIVSGREDSPRQKEIQKKLEDAKPGGSIRSVCFSWPEEDVRVLIGLPFAWAEHYGRDDYQQTAFNLRSYLTERIERTKILAERAKRRRATRNIA